MGVTDTIQAPAAGTPVEEPQVRDRADVARQIRLVITFAISLALLGRATPLGTVLAGLLFGALSSGGLAMQAAAGVPPEMSQVLQALIVLFVAAPALVRGVFHMRGTGQGTTVMAKGW